MFTIFDYLYDISYFIIKNMEELRWQPLLFYLFYLFGKRSGMKLFRKFMVTHFKYLEDEESQWKKYVNKQLLKLGADEFLPQHEYRGVTRSRVFFRKNGNMSLTSSQTAISQEGNGMKKLIIDPGHGGKDSGAVSCTKKLEKTFNLNVALKVADLFKNHPEVEVILTRSTDIFIELNQRSDMANLLKADAFISIHANSFMKSSNGTETYYTNDFSRAFAEAFHPYMVQATGFKRNKVIRKSLSVTRKTNMPSILLEPGFLSNPEEEAVLMTDEFQTRFSLAIAQGACAFLGVPYSVSTTSPTQTSTLTSISVIVNAQTLTGYLLNGTAWIPAKPVLNYLQALWTFQDKKIVLNAAPIETMIVDNQSYIKARDIMTISRVFFDDTEKPKRIDIFPNLEVLK